MKTLFVIFVIISWFLSRNKKLKTDLSQKNSFGQSFSLDGLTSKFNNTPEYARPSFSEPKLASTSGLGAGQVVLILFSLAAVFLYLEYTNTTNIISAQDKEAIKYSLQDSMSSQTEYNSDTSQFVKFESEQSSTTTINPTIVKSSTSINISTFYPPGVSFNLPNNVSVQNLYTDSIYQLQFTRNNAELLVISAWKNPPSLDEDAGFEEVTFGENTWRMYYQTDEITNDKITNYYYILSSDDYSYETSNPTEILPGSDQYKILSGMKIN